jgi:hypothetical protein
MFFNIRREVTGYRRRKSGRVLPDYSPIISIYDRGLIYRIYKDSSGYWRASCKAGMLNVGCVSHLESRVGLQDSKAAHMQYRPLTLSEVIKLVQSKVESGIYEDLRRFLRNYDAIAESVED